MVGSISQTMTPHSHRAYLSTTGPGPLFQPGVKNVHDHRRDIKADHPLRPKRVWLFDIIVHFDAEFPRATTEYYGPAGCDIERHGCFVDFMIVSDDGRRADIPRVARQIGAEQLNRRETNIGVTRARNVPLVARKGAQDITLCNQADKQLRPEREPIRPEIVVGRRRDCRDNTAGPEKAFLCGSGIDKVEGDVPEAGFGFELS